MIQRFKNINFAMLNIISIVSPWIDVFSRVRFICTMERLILHVKNDSNFNLRV